MKTKTQYLFLISLLLLIGIVAVNFYAGTRIKYKTEAIKSHYQEDFKNKNIQLSTTLKKDSVILTEQQRILEKVFLTQEEIIPFITKIESLASTQNLKVSIDKVERGAEETVGQTYKIQPVSFNISADGSFEQIKYFIDTIESSDTLVEVKEFKIYNTTTDSNIYNARIIITSSILIL